MEDGAQVGGAGAGGVPGGPVVGVAVARVADHGLAGGCEGLGDGKAFGKAEMCIRDSP